MFIHCHIEPLKNVPTPEKLSETNTLMSLKEQSIHTLKHTDFGRFFVQKIVDMNGVLEDFYGVTDIGKSEKLKVSTSACVLAYFVTMFWIQKGDSFIENIFECFSGVIADVFNVKFNHHFVGICVFRGGCCPSYLFSTPMTSNNIRPLLAFDRHCEIINKSIFYFPQLFSRPTVKNY